MLSITPRATRGTSTYVLVVISPATTQRPVVTSTSQATRPVGSSCRTASRTASEIWSAILSGCPSVTDSDVKICLSFSAISILYEHRSARVFPLHALNRQGGHLRRG